MFCFLCRIWHQTNELLDSDFVCYREPVVYFGLKIKSKFVVHVAKYSRQQSVTISEVSVDECD